MRDDMETSSMNELFGKGEDKVALVYTYSNDDVTSILVANTKGTVYFSDVIDVPEITGIQRGVSFVKHHLSFDRTEIYPLMTDHKLIQNDAYINYCKVNHSVVEEPNWEIYKKCKQNFQIHNRWNIKNEISR